MIKNPENFWIFYFIVFSVVISCLAAFSWKGEDCKIKLTTISFLILISILFAIRGASVGLDTSSYIALVMKGQHITADEYFFLKLAEVSKILTKSHELFFVITSLTISLFFLYASKIALPKNYPLTIAILLSTFFFLIIQISAIRQGLALSLSAMSVAFLLRRKVILFFIFLIFAYGFHKSAIITAAFYPVYLFRKSDKIWFIIALAVFGSFLLPLAQIIEPLASYHSIFNKAYWYLTWESGTPWKVKHFYYFVIVFLIALIILRKRLDDTERLSALLLLTGFIFVGISQAGEMMADRLFYYSIFPGVLVLSSITRFIRRERDCGFFIIIILTLNLWFMTTYMLQYPRWFIPPYEAIAKK